MPQVKAEYERVKAQRGDKEYKVRHILVEKEDEAKQIVAELKKGRKFEELAKQSKDPGSKDRGGDLDWNAPAGYVKPFADALVKLDEGQVHRGAGADPVRLARHPARGRAADQVPDARGSQAADHPEPAAAAVLTKAVKDCGPRRRSSERHYPTHTRALRNIRIHGLSSPQSSGCQEHCTVRNTRSGCGIRIVKRPSAW